MSVLLPAPDAGVTDATIAIGVAEFRRLLEATTAASTIAVPAADDADNTTTSSGQRPSLDGNVMLRAFAALAAVNVDSSPRTVADAVALVRAAIEAAMVDGDTHADRRRSPAAEARAGRVVAFTPMLVERAPLAAAADLLATELAAAALALVDAAVHDADALRRQDGDDAEEDPDPCRRARHALRAVRMGGQLAREVVSVAVAAVATRRTPHRPATAVAPTARERPADSSVVPLTPTIEVGAQASSDGEVQTTVAAAAAAPPPMPRDATKALPGDLVARLLARLLSANLAACRALGPDAVHAVPVHPNDTPVAVWRARALHVVCTETMRACAAAVTSAGKSTSAAPSGTATSAAWTPLQRSLLHDGRVGKLLARLGCVLDPPSVLLLVSAVDALQVPLDRMCGGGGADDDGRHC